ncbi:DUF814 domain-containing protein [Candidatus Woesearchaeota archaeon]|nr:DUF814 domain-containing protein [Candidatus Woesearchaeota archaeon]
MEISLDIRKTIDENAASYFEAAKKAKRKLAGAEKALEKSQQQLELLLQKKGLAAVEKSGKSAREKKWYEKFRWFVSSEGFLCVGGRDAATNEIVVKKHAENNDIVFHAQMQGSPFFVVKAENKKVGQNTLEEAAIATAAFSRAWKLGLSHADVFYVKPEQLSRSPKPGEYLEKGSFIIKGKTADMLAELKLAVGMADDGSIMCGPVAAVRKQCKNFVEIRQGSEKTSAAAKKIQHRIGGELDEIIRALPSGGVKLA